MLQVSAEPISNLGGVGLLVSRLIKGLPPSYQVDLACPDAKSEGFPNDLRERTNKVITTPLGHWSIAEKRQFLQRTSNQGYDLIHFHGGTLSFDSYLPWRSPLHGISRLRLPWIYTNHCATKLTNGLYADGYHLPGKIVKTVLGFCSLARAMGQCSRPIFVSQENQNRIARCFPWLKRRFMTIYPSCLTGQPPEAVVRERAVTIGNLGHIGWRKGQFDLLEAFCLLAPKFSELKLLLVGPDGSGDCADRIRAEIIERKLQGRVLMPGGTKDTTSFWDDVDIYVQPSHYEGAPMALMEAVWHGKPCIGTRVSGIPEIIEHELNGLLVWPQKPAELACAIERLVSDLPLRKRLSKAGPAHILSRGMTLPQMVERYVLLYEELLSRRAKTPARNASH